MSEQSTLSGIQEQLIAALEKSKAASKTLEDAKAKLAPLEAKAAEAQEQVTQLMNEYNRLTGNVPVKRSARRGAGATQGLCDLERIQNCGDGKAILYESDQCWQERGRSKKGGQRRCESVGCEVGSEVILVRPDRLVRDGSDIVETPNTVTSGRKQDIPLLCFGRLFGRRLLVRRKTSDVSLEVREASAFRRPPLPFLVRHRFSDCAYGLPTTSFRCLAQASAAVWRPCKEFFLLTAYAKTTSPVF